MQNKVINILADKLVDLAQCPLLCDRLTVGKCDKQTCLGEPEDAAECWIKWAYQKATEEE